MLGTWRDVINIRISGWGLEIHIGVVLVGLIVALLILSAIVRHRNGWQVKEANFEFAGFGNLKMCPTDDVAVLAHQAWVELSTRKAALAFDEDHDVIVEVYNSWYELFRALREIAKNVPTCAGLRDGSDEARLVEVLSGALNEGLRPHLTRWQARFRRWYDEQHPLPDSAGMSPQDLQRRFPDYDALIRDLRDVSGRLAEFTEALRKLAHDRQRAHWWRLRRPRT